MDVDKVEERLKIRAAAHADNFLDNVQLRENTEADPKVRAMARNALIAGWLVGYAAAMGDVVFLRQVAGAVKH